MLGTSIPANKPQPPFITAEFNFIFIFINFKIARTRNGALKG